MSSLKTHDHPRHDAINHEQHRIQNSSLRPIPYDLFYTIMRNIIIAPCNAHIVDAVSRTFNNICHLGTMNSITWHDLIYYAFTSTPDITIKLALCKLSCYMHIYSLSNRTIHINIGPIFTPQRNSIQPQHPTISENVRLSHQEKERHKQYSVTTQKVPQGISENDPQELYLGNLKRKFTPHHPLDKTDSIAQKRSIFGYEARTDAIHQFSQHYPDICKKIHDILCSEAINLNIKQNSKRHLARNALRHIYNHFISLLKAQPAQDIKSNFAEAIRQAYDQANNRGIRTTHVAKILEELTKYQWNTILADNFNSPYISHKDVRNNSTQGEIIPDHQSSDPNIVTEKPKLQNGYIILSKPKTNSSIEAIPENQSHSSRTTPNIVEIKPKSQDDTKYPTTMQGTDISCVQSESLNLYTKLSH